MCPTEWVNNQKFLEILSLFCQDGGEGGGLVHGVICSALSHTRLQEMGLPVAVASPSGQVDGHVPDTNAEWEKS
ncbi:MAG: hypothetical protein H7836_10700 [Magnetococcus sp. YQC-3]